MRKYRFFCKQNMVVGQETCLEQTVAHHIARVLRLEAGEIIYLFNNTGVEFCAQITHSSKSLVKVVITAVEQPHTESLLKLHLGLAIIKFDKIDLILQKACELGLSKISLINTKHTSIKSAYARAVEKFDHWQKILESAAGQCWRTIVPELTIVESFENFLTNQEADLKLILDPRAPKNNQINNSCKPQAITTLIGPEGGFSEQEVDLAIRQEFRAMNLGPRILRTETACFCALTILQAQYGDLLC
jgi:16S rRNA (uracil1498-N3)-methyltransferase